MYQCDLLKGKDEKRGYTATFTHSENQKWYYLRKHRTDEVTAIKIWDSETNGVSRCMCPAACPDETEDIPLTLMTVCAHASFTHPDTPAHVEPRESVEVRCIVIQ